MCRVMSVSRSGFYEWLSRPVSKRSQEDQALKADIRVIHENNRQLYGERRIKSELADLGKHVSRKRVGRLMKEEGLKCRTKRKFKATTDSSHNKPVADNLLRREFNRKRPDQAYVGDITYIPTREGWLYLSVYRSVLKGCGGLVYGKPDDSNPGNGLSGDGYVEAQTQGRPAGA